MSENQGTPSKTVEQQLTDKLKEAMRAKDQPTKNVIGMIKTRVMERRTAPGFSGEVNDALYLEVIAAYAKQLKKAMGEFPEGERGDEARAQTQFEIDFCQQFLPKGASQEVLLAAVREAIARLGVKDPKQAGKVVGEVMKAHKGQAEPGEVKKLVDQELAKG